MKSFLKLASFRKCRAGNVSLMFGLAIIPVVGTIGLAVDYSRASTLRSEMQKASDSAAIAMVMADHAKRPADLEKILLGQVSPGVTFSDLKTKGNWIISGKRYRVVTTANLPTTFAAIFVPNFKVSAATSAELITQGVEVQLEAASLEPEAGDYNELRVYCFKASTNERLGPIDTVTGQRLPIKKLADNSPAGVAKGSEHTGSVLCGVGETVSIQMHNIRDARTKANPYNEPASKHFDYYTDTTEDGSKVEFHTEPAKMIETIYCTTKEKCSKKKAQNGDIPNRQTNRQPAVNTTPCTSGFMYMGWEDRPPTDKNGNPTASDKDYDDIAIVMSCHAKDATAQMLVRIVE
jgi:Flp pilus assembly protein TadG